MSATSTTSPVSPIQHRDIRSASQPFKRDKDNTAKWSMGVRPSSGVSIDIGGPDMDVFVGNSSEGQRARVRPHKQWSQMTNDYKSHANKTPKPTSHDGYYDPPRLHRKVDAELEATEHSTSPLSKSLLELLPSHANNTNTSITTALRAGADDGILYSFDNKGKSPGVKGREVDLGGLVELAEKKWAAEQTDRIVKGEYEVIDSSGESVVVGKKGKKSPKSRAKEMEIKNAGDDDEGFELI